jgi:hypothetical protein
VVKANGSNMVAIEVVVGACVAVSAVGLEVSPDHYKLIADRMLEPLDRSSAGISSDKVAWRVQAGR